jgi:acyl-CoA dehydrogenase
LTENLQVELPDEFKMLQEMVRRFVDDELIPLEGKSLVDGQQKLKPDIKAKLTERCKELGLWQIDVPEEFGGQGLGVLGRSIVWSELGRTVALPTRVVRILGPEIRAPLYALKGEMRERYLMPSARGERESCFAQTEPDAGSDPGAMRTTAVRDGDHYVINGTKRFITGADDAHFTQLIAATDRSKGSHGGISAFIVDMKSPGVRLLRAQELVIDDRPWEIAFEDVKVPVENRIGEEGDGFRHAQHWLSVGRIRHGARSMGVIERCLELGTQHAKQRVTFGKPLAERQAVQWMLAESFMELHQLRLMVYDAAWKYDQGRDIRTEAYMAKIFGDTQSFHAADRCMEIHGGMGLATDLPIEKFWRDQRSMMITEGPIEILKMALARHVLRTYE